MTAFIFWKKIFFSITRKCAECFGIKFDHQMWCTYHVHFQGGWWEEGLSQKWDGIRRGGGVSMCSECTIFNFYLLKKIEFAPLPDMLSQTLDSVAILKWYYCIMCRVK